MGDSGLPPVGGGAPDEAQLAVLVERGRVELDDVDDRRLVAIWRRVDAELDLEDPAVRTAVGSVPAPGGHEVGAAAAPAAPIPIRGWRRHVPMAAAAALALVVGAGVGLALAPSQVEPSTAEVATWRLEPLEGVDAAVEETGAVLRDDGDALTVELVLDDLPATDGFHEVWLLDPATGALASLGPVRPDGRYVVPSGADLDRLTALDVSREPLDGDPGHSGDSLLRGEVVWVG